MKFSGIVALGLAINVAAIPNSLVRKADDTPAAVGSVDSMDNGASAASSASADMSGGMKSDNDADTSASSHAASSHAAGDATAADAAGDMNADAAFPTLPTLTTLPTLPTLTTSTSVPSITLPSLPSITVPSLPSPTNAGVIGTLDNALSVLISTITKDLTAINTLLVSTRGNIGAQVGSIVSVTVNLVGIISALIQAIATITTTTLGAVPNLDPTDLATLASAINALATLLKSLSRTVQVLLSNEIPVVGRLIPGLVNGILILLAPLLTPLESFVNATTVASGAATNGGLTALKTALTALESSVSALVHNVVPS